MESSITALAEIIQIAVAPVFLLAGVAGLLNVFTGRLSRIIDKVEKLDASAEHENNEDRRLSLTLRMQNINYAISLCTMTGLLIALVIVTMFLSSMFEFNGSIFIATLFIFAMVSLISSLVLFQKEIFFTTSLIKKKSLKK